MTENAPGLDDHPEPNSVTGSDSIGITDRVVLHRISGVCRQSTLNTSNRNASSGPFLRV